MKTILKQVCTNQYVQKAWFLISETKELYLLIGVVYVVELMAGF